MKHIGTPGGARPDLAPLDINGWFTLSADYSPTDGQREFSNNNIIGKQEAKRCLRKQ